MKRILIFISHYLPGYRTGGPVRSIAAMTRVLGHHYNFGIVTTDRDYGEDRPYPNIAVDTWQDVEGTPVYYASKLDASTIISAVEAFNPDIIYLNSYFSWLTRRVLMLRLRRKIKDVPVILAPRGEFSPEALRLKKLKKRLFIAAAGFARLYNGLVWHASSELEKECMSEFIDTSSVHVASIYVAPEITAFGATVAGHPAKCAGKVKFVFLSRVSPMKNLEFLLRVLPGVRGDVELVIVGPVEEVDAQYWSKCQSIIETLPQNIRVEYRGGIPHEQVPGCLQQQHFFVLPTRGENFGHAILEALTSGTPVLLSDRTPWCDLQKGHAGFDVPLDERLWVTAAQRCVDMDEHEYRLFVEGAKKYSSKYTIEYCTDQHVGMFESVCEVSIGKC